MNSWPFQAEGKPIKTLYEGLQRNLSRIPAHPLLGTKRGNSYEWMTVKEVSETALALASGCMALDLVPEVQAEDTTYRFIGVQAKNRKEWSLQHIANFHMGVTTVALYDTLGADAARYVIDQTELTTIVCSDDLVAKILALK